MLTGNGGAHHGDILRKATGLIEAGKIATRIDPRHFTLDTILEAHQALKDGTAAGRIVVDVA
jgi:NADPH:quinone reductase-like Zn-dependent oxidoreductase